jgi:homopolymeric O-antigen transport system ATP-binding protein
LREPSIILDKVSLHYSPAMMGRKMLFTRPFFGSTPPLVALKSVSIVISPGQSLGVVGSNGAGKSSFLRVCAGILDPTAGRVRITENVTALIDLGAGLEGALSGFDNIELAAKLQRIPKSRHAEFVDYVREFSELGDALARPVRTFSSGMTLRLIFSLRTFLQPDLLVVDEIFGVGDRNFSIKAKERTTELLRGASSLILASHDANLIREFCTSAIWLERGRVKLHGPVDDVLEAYAEVTG